MSLTSHLLTPAVPLHELTHALAARALPDRWCAVTGGHLGRDTADVRFEWFEGTPAWAIFFVHLAPLLVGLGVALVTLALFGLPTPGDVAGRPFHEVGLAVILALNWVIFTYPSREDRDPFGAGSQ